LAPVIGEAKSSLIFLSCAAQAFFEITWPGMEIPVQVIMPTCVITLFYEDIIVGTIMPGDTSDLTFQNVGTTSFVKIKLQGDETLQHKDCLVNKYVEDPSKCQLAKLVDTLLKGAMETGGPLDLTVVITYDNEVTGQSQEVAIDISLFRIPETGRPQPGEESVLAEDARTPSPTPAESYCNGVYDELGLAEIDKLDYTGKCCNSYVHARARASEARAREARASEASTKEEGCW
jgi:hypothetical protein